jgi:hypothetical protein
MGTGEHAWTVKATSIVSVFLLMLVVNVYVYVN